MAGFTFMAEQDGIDDDREFVRLAIVQSLPQGVSIGARATTTVNIGDVDDPKVKVSFERRFVHGRGGIDNDCRDHVERRS